MAKKLILLGMAVTALAAFAMPAVAGASPELRDASGKVAVNSATTFTSTNFVITTTKFGDVECTHALFSGEVSANSGSSVAETGTGGAATDCFADSFQVTVTKPHIQTMATSGGDAGSLSVTFIVESDPFECHFEGTGSFTYATGQGNDSIHIAGITLTGPEICLCEDEETGEPAHPTFHADFTQTTESGGGKIWIQ